MEQWIENKFKCMMILNRAIEEQCISKKDYESVIKHILKSNLLLVKHYPLFKDFINKMVTECNELLSLGFFMNEKILVIWIARKLNHYVKVHKYISVQLREYLDDKNKKMKKYANKYYNKLYERSLISCDDRCFQDYLPTQNAMRYGSFVKETDSIYCDYDKDNLYYRTLNKDELLNIKDFRICILDENVLRRDIFSRINKFKETKESGKYTSIYDSGVNVIFKCIKWFENVNVYGNCKSEFTKVINEMNRYYSSELYVLLKMDRFNYDVNDIFFVTDLDDRDLICELNSTNEISYMIDVPLWIGYMQSHDIMNLDEMYLEKNFVGTIYN